MNSYCYRATALLLFAEALKAGQVEGLGTFDVVDLYKKASAAKAAAPAAKEETPSYSPHEGTIARAIQLLYRAPFNTFLSIVIHLC